MEPFYESPFYALITGIPICVLLIAIWLQTGIHKLLIAAVIVAALTVTMVLVENTVKTPRERIYDTIFAIANAVENEDFERAVGYVSPNAEIVRSQALAELNKYDISSVSIKSNLIVLYNEDTSPPTASTGFNVVVKGSSQRLGITNQIVPRYLQVDFEYEQSKDAWYVTSYGHSDIREGIQVEKRLRDRGAK